MFTTYGRSAIVDAAIAVELEMLALAFDQQGPAVDEHEQKQLERQRNENRRQHEHAHRNQQTGNDHVDDQEGDDYLQEGLIAGEYQWHQQNKGQEPVQDHLD